MVFLIFCLYGMFLLWSLFSLIFPEYYFSELVLSFLPYNILISFLWIIFWFLFLKFFAKKIIIRRWMKIKILVAFLILLSWLVFSLYSKKFTYFYHVNIQQIQEDMAWWIKILYANIYKNNTNYTGIQYSIEKENPDLIMFVEFADHHYLHLKDFLTENYPYSNSTHWSKTYIWNMVFSKIKIENWADDFPQWAWRYWYFSIDYQNKPMYFYLVHMSSPVSKKYFDMRNQQISYFFENFTLHQNIHRIKQDKVIALGDFNTSPWSTFYWNFAKGFEWEFINITRSFPLLFTWKSLGFPLLWTHIDHIFVNKFVTIKDLHIVDISGSDHKWFSFLIK